MNKNRLEAFSDGVLAIIITIMVLEIHVPHGANFAMLATLWPTLTSYLLSFVFIGIYWNNHHHLLHTLHNINAAVMWSNLNLLFWLSLVPFATAWMGESNFNRFTVIVYAVLILLCGASYEILRRCIYRTYDPNTPVSGELRQLQTKGNWSLLLYLTSIGTAYIHTGISISLFAIVSVMWIIPSKAIENTVHENR